MLFPVPQVAVAGAVLQAQENSNERDDVVASIKLFALLALAHVAGGDEGATDQDSLKAMALLEQYDVSSTVARLTEEASRCDY